MIKIEVRNQGGELLTTVKATNLKQICSEIKKTINSLPSKKIRISFLEGGNRKIKKEINKIINPHRNHLKVVFRKKRSTL